MQSGKDCKPNPHSAADGIRTGVKGQGKTPQHRPDRESCFEVKH